MLLLSRDINIESMTLEFHQNSEASLENESRERGTDARIRDNYKKFELVNNHIQRS